MVDAVFNSLLVGSAGYAMAQIQPAENPFIFTACAVGLCHGLLGIYGNVAEGTSNSKEAEETTGTAISKIHTVTRSCVEIITFPLINIGFYQASQQSSPLALGHGLFIIPLAFDLSFKVFDVADDGDTTETLKELTTLGNIVSLMFLAMNENQLPFGLMALAALYADYAPWVMESLYKGSGENAGLIGYSMFYSMIPWAIASAGESTAVA